MSLSAKYLAFNIGIGTTPVVVAGVGFQPKAVLFFAIGRTDAVDAGGRADPNRMAGFAAATTQGGGTKQSAVCTRTQDALATGVADSGHSIRSDACVVAVTATGTIDGRASLASFNADGITLNIDDQFTVNQRVLALFLGGSDLVNIEMGAFNSPTTGVLPFAQDVTTGFTCADNEGVLFVLGGKNNADNNNGADSSFSFGAATAPGSSQFSLHGATDDQHATTTLGIRRLRRSAVYASPSGTIASIVRQANLNAWITNGFRLEWNDISSIDARLYWLVIKGARWKVLSGLTATSLAAIPLTGALCTPVAGLVASVHAAGEHSGSSSSFESGDHCSIGAFSGLTARGAVAQHVAHGVATSVTSTRVEHDAVMAQIDSAGAVTGLMDLQSLDADGVTFVMDDADPAQAYFATLLVGNPSGVGGGAGGGLAPRRRRRR